MKFEKKIATLLYSTLFSSIIYSQGINFTSNITFEVEEIKYKKTTRGRDCWSVAPDGYKQIVLYTNLYNRNEKKRNYHCLKCIMKLRKKIQSIVIFRC